MDGMLQDFSTVASYGPKTEAAIQIFRDKYAAHEHETFTEACWRLACDLADDEAHRDALFDGLQRQINVPAGRIWAASGTGKSVTYKNCFHAPMILDSLAGHDGILSVFHDAMITMQQGGGIGFNFSNLRPEGDPIKGVGSTSSGPISFMEIYDTGCRTIRSSGHRRGAMMATMICHHPDIEAFIDCKRNSDKLTNFNISVLCTDEFMFAVENDLPFDLHFNGEWRKTVRARDLWNKIMKNNWEYAEPGVQFIDTINKFNNLWYVEEILGTNPCGEVPLPANGACLLGSINIAKLVRWGGTKWEFDWDGYKKTIAPFFAAMDNVIDKTRYPTPAQEAEQKSKRRVGVGVTGIADAIHAMGEKYGTDEYLYLQDRILETLRNECYAASIELASRKGAFPLFDRDKFLMGENIKKLPEHLQEGIYKHGIRNGTCNSIAPTGTISLFGDNVSSGIEPPFSIRQKRIITRGNGVKDEVELLNYAFMAFGVVGTCADEVTATQHVDVLARAQYWTDQAVSKTCNIGDEVTEEEFSDIYMRAYKSKAKGCTTFRAAGYRKGILNSLDTNGQDGAACMYDPATGEKTCS